MNFKAIAYYLSLFCFPISFLSFINILYSLYFDYFLSIDLYFLTLISSLIFSSILYFFGRKAEKKLNFFDQITLILLTYLILSIFISIPYYFSNYQLTIINSLFESFSGLTGTGFTIFDNIKYLDPTLILWRSSSQWIGGFYFLIFLLIIFSSKQFNYKLTYMVFNITESNNENIIKSNIFKIFIIYSSLTFFIFLLLSFFDIRLFNALNLCMTLISTGGFLPTNSLDQIIINNKQEFALILSLLISMLNFFLIFNIFSEKKFFETHQEDIFLFFIFLIFTLILLLVVKDIRFQSAAFSILSSLGNSGLSIQKIPETLNLYFLFLAIIGGSIISNTSGIKFMRFYILIKSSISEILKLVRPNNVINQNLLYSNKKVVNEDIRIAFLIFVMFFASLFLLSGFLILDTIDFKSSFTLSILTLTNTVNSDLYGNAEIDFSNLLTSSKIFLIIFMIVAKIELLSFFLIIKKLLFKN